MVEFSRSRKKPDISQSPTMGYKLLFSLLELLLAISGSNELKTEEADIWIDPTLIRPQFLFLALLHLPLELPTLSPPPHHFPQATAAQQAGRNSVGISRLPKQFSENFGADEL